MSASILFYSDLHLSIGPRVPIRPEMRRFWCRFGWCGEKLMDRFEDRLRMESGRIQRITRAWLSRHATEYDFLINGGDLALPLALHDERMDATQRIWRDELATYGENRYFALTGNHELGYGYDPEPDSYPDLMSLRNTLFHNEINLHGFGRLRIEEVSVLFLDSELLSIAFQRPYDPEITQTLQTMLSLVQETIESDDPVVIFTHNTIRLRRWMIQAGGLWNRLLARGRRVILIGGHFHIPRMMKRSGAEIHWSGGASYPEPMLRYLVRVPFTGILRGGAGGVEVFLENGGIAILHRSFNHPKQYLAVSAA
ncbi:MAG: metallophosphoesterase [bacterium]